MSAVALANSLEKTTSIWDLARNINDIDVLLATLPKNLQNVVVEIQKESQAPIPSIVTAVLAVISLVCQGRVRIRKRPRLISPVSLWFIVVQASGERKSSVMKIVLRSVEKFIEEQSEAHRRKMEEYADDLVAWKTERKGILASIRKNSEKNEATDEGKHRLALHNLSKPLMPKHFKFIHEKATPSAIIKNLSEAFPTTGIVSDEAAVVFQSRGMSDLGLLNKGWDGSTISADFSSKASQVAVDPSIMMVLYAQREIVEAYFAGKGELARAVGFLSRCFYVTPPESAGSRLLAYSVPADPAVLDLFYDRCSEILQSHIGEDDQKLPKKIELYFSPEAQSRWDEIHDKIEVMMRPGNFFCNDKDFASKHADKIARLAALLHHFEGNEGPINLETLEHAIAISGWYAEEFVRNFAKPPQEPQEQVDARLLLVWLANFIRTSGQFSIKKTEVLQYGPSRLRNKIHLNAALLLLRQRNIAGEVKVPTGKKATAYIEMNMQYFTPAEIQFVLSQGVSLN